MLRWPPEHGAWAMVLASWACGWAASRTSSWEVLLLPVAGWLAFAAARSLRCWRKSESAGFPVLSAVLPGIAAGVLAAIAVREAPWAWKLALAVPSVAYAAVLSMGDERAPWARMVATVALTAVGAAAFGAAGGVFGAGAALVWVALATYFVLVACLIMARLRRSGGALWGARVGSAAAAAGAVVAAVFGSLAWPVAPAFFLAAARSWSPAPQGRVDAASAGKAELYFSSAALVLLAIGL